MFTAKNSAQFFVARYLLNSAVLIMPIETSILQVALGDMNEVLDGDYNANNLPQGKQRLVIYAISFTCNYFPPRHPVCVFLVANFPDVKSIHIVANSTETTFTALIYSVLILHDKLLTNQNLRLKYCLCYLICKNIWLQLTCCSTKRIGQ
jgi:hypothetical protein